MSKLSKKVLREKAGAKKSDSGAGGGGGPDPRFAPVARAFARTPGFSLMESKSQAMRGMMLNGKSFGMSSHGRLILKLDEATVAALVADGVGKPFAPSPGRVMKGWIEVTDSKADWIALARQAYRLASARGERPSPKREG